MARRHRIAAYIFTGLATCLLLVIGWVYYATQQVRPFYQQALRMEPEVLERGSRELESQATALYSDARKAGEWRAVFTAEQINGWLAVQLMENLGNTPGEPSRIRDPRVAISPDLLTMGFRTATGSVISIDANVFLTDEGAVAVRLLSLRAGALPLPVMQLADEIAEACQKLQLPIRWTRHEGKPVAIVELHSDVSTDKRQFFIDSIELRDRELYVAGHTELGNATGSAVKTAEGSDEISGDVELADFELRISPGDERSKLEVARRSEATESRSNSDDQ